MIHGGQDLPSQDDLPGSKIGSRKGSTTSSVGTETGSQLDTSGLCWYLHSHSALECMICISSISYAD